MTSNAKTVTEPTIPAVFPETHGIATTTTNSLPGHHVIKNLGTIYGLTVRSRNWGADLGGFLRSSVGGELSVFTKMLYTARDVALDRMVGECLARGGNAVLGVRMDVVSEGVWCQVCAYGTAVVVEQGRTVKGEEQLEVEA